MQDDNDSSAPPPGWWPRLRQRLRAAWARVVALWRRIAGRGVPEERPVEALEPPEPAPPPVEVTPPEPAPAPPEAPPPAPRAPHPEPEFLSATFTHPQGTRAYRLFLPGVDTDAPRPLVVMLHGCRQNPDDFATGTRMNEIAQAHGIVVLYPGQSMRANHLGCWNWFHPENQRRDHGEPAILADLTRHVMATQPIDPARVYVAGLSAGGAMSAVLAATYPDVFAAVGIHSGLPHAAASNLATALSAMRHGPLERKEPAARAPVPTIVFHGDQDRTVHPDNGEEVIAQARWGREAQDDADDGAGMTVERGAVPGGRSYTRTLHRDADGRCDAEHWLVHGSGHAWSGGHAMGSYTDPLGPDASVQMLRFFIEHPKRAG
jgi:poly(hydroxyalkanoate) depolymerase family esterase